jgi:transcriptional regulator of acetoin/glycerol metabolism
MAPTNAVLDSHSVAPRSNVAIITPDSELGRALRRVQELEGELQRLREAGGGSEAAPLQEMHLLDVEGLLVRRAMERHRGNVSRAARALGLSRSALYRRLERHKIEG